MLNRAFVAQLAPFLDRLWRGEVILAWSLVARPLLAAMAKLCGLLGAPRSEGLVHGCIRLVPCMGSNAGFVSARHGALFIGERRSLAAKRKEI